MQHTQYTEQPTTILVQLDANFKLIANNGLVLNIKNNDILKKLFEKITSVLCYDEELYNKLINSCNLNPDGMLYLDVEGSNNFHVFEEEKVQHQPNVGYYDAKDNGLECYYPEYVQELASHIDAEEYNWNLLFDYHLEVIKNFVDLPEPVVQLGIMAKKSSKYGEAMNFLDRAIKISDQLGKEQETYRKYNKVIIAERADCLSKKGQYKESFDILNDLLKTTEIPENYRKEVETYRDQNIDYFKDEYLVYPNQKIKELKKTGNKKIMFSITTCKRFDLFEKTINSFINTCKDINLIDYWFCVDDNSSEEDRKKMESNYPFFNFYWKKPSEKGHAISMNIIYEHMDTGFEYLLHMEDDFHFIEKRNFISDAMAVLNDNDNYGQVLFNRNYAEIDRSKMTIGGGIPKTTVSITQRYVEHEHYKDGTEEYKEFIERNKNVGTNGYWPYFSFRPSLLKCSVLKKLGPFYNTPHFEMAYAHEYCDNGFKSAFLDTFACIHIGKKTWEKDQQNAYNLNETSQFSSSDSDMSTRVLSIDKDSWRGFKQRALHMLSNYTRTKLRNVEYLSNEHKKLFNDNSFNYRRDNINPIVTQLDMWKEYQDTKNKYLMVLTENVYFRVDFENCIKELLEIENVDQQKFDMIVLGYETNDSGELDHKFIKIDPAHVTKPIAGYILSKSGASKLSNLIQSNGIKTELYEFISTQELDIFEYTVVTAELKEKASYVELPGYKFYSQLDSHGGDLKWAGNLSVSELQEICDKENCTGFNTLGYIKKTLHPADEFIFLWNSKSAGDGLYVKI